MVKKQIRWIDRCLKILGEDYYSCLLVLLQIWLQDALFGKSPLLFSIQQTVVKDTNCWHLWAHNQLNKNWHATLTLQKVRFFILKSKQDPAIPLLRCNTWWCRITFKFGPQNERHATNHLYCPTFLIQNIDDTFYFYTLINRLQVNSKFLNSSLV